MYLYPKIMMWLAAFGLYIMLSFVACDGNDPLTRKFAEKRQLQQRNAEVSVPFVLP